MRNIKVIKKLSRNISQSIGSYLNYIGGYDGTGKRNLALLQAELWQFLTGGEIVSNIESCPQAVYAGGVKELDDWIAENPDVEFIFVYDGPVDKELASLLKIIRKVGGNCIIIGESGESIPAEVRRLCEYTQKESKRTANVYDCLGFDGRGEGHITTLEGIPPTSLDYDRTEASEWSWSTDDSQNEGDSA